MANLTHASRELFRRQPDEVFADLQSLHAHCLAEKNISTDRWTPPQELQPRPGASGITLQVAGTDGFWLNDWAFTQLCVMSGVAKDTVNKLSPATASLVLRETLPESNKPLQIFTQGSTVRSIHGHAYSRLYNADLVHMIREFGVDLVPPPKSPINGATGLYCGEQDLFCFLIDPTGWAEINGQAFAPGFMIWNSEVGKRSVGISTFWFQQICQNHIVWDATEVVEFTRKHTGKVGEALGDIRRIVEQLVEKRDSRRDGFVGTIRKAMETEFGGADETLKLLTKNGFTRQLAKRAVEGAFQDGQRFTVFSVVDALTRLAQEHKYAGDRVAADEKASALLILI